MHVRHTTVDTAVGGLTFVATDDAVTGVYFPGHWHRPSAETLGAEVDGRHDELLESAAAQVGAYLDGDRTSFDLPTATHGDTFQEQVWALLEQIPYGGTTTYGRLAERLGDKSLARAVGGAVGHNPLSIIIPCHRVVGTDGRLTGYAGGLRRKQLLLELEESAETTASRLF